MFCREAFVVGGMEITAPRMGVDGHLRRFGAETCACEHREIHFIMHICMQCICTEYQAVSEEDCDPLEAPKTLHPAI